MNVKELIEQLESYPADAIVYQDAREGVSGYVKVRSVGLLLSKGGQCSAIFTSQVPDE